MERSEEKVVLVDQEDKEIGVLNKIEAHQKGLLHRAFSVFLYNDKNEILLQQRAPGKYHSPDLWTNACCSHPRLHETYLNGAKRRIEEELGIKTDLDFKFKFIYKADVGKGLWEHELDHVFIGKFNGDFNINPEEVQDIKWETIDFVKQDIQNNPHLYTEWFKIIFNEYLTEIKK